MDSIEKNKSARLKPKALWLEDLSIVPSSESNRIVLAQAKETLSCSLLTIATLPTELLSGFVC